VICFCIRDIEEELLEKMAIEFPHNTLKNGKRERYIHFGGRAAFHNECGLQCARCFNLRLTKMQPFHKGGNNRRK